MRIVSPSWFLAQAAVLDWAAVARTWTTNSPAGPPPSIPVDLDKAASRHNYQLRWMLSPQFGLPRTPFRVFFLNAKIEMTPVASAEGDLNEISGFQLDVPAARVIIIVDLTDAGASAFGMNGDDKMVAFSTQSGGGTQGLLLDGNCITSVLVVGSGTIKGVWIAGSEALANHASWQEVERVGLPVAHASDFAGTGYDTSPQGLVGSPVSPNDAARRRLAAGAPLVGWGPTLPSGSAAPGWAGAVSPPLVSPLPFLTDAQANFLPKLAKMMKQSGTPWKDKDVLLDQTIEVKAPGGQTSSLPSNATYSPLQLLLLAASADPFNALGLGFGTAYTLAELTKLKPAESAVVQHATSVLGGRSLPVSFIGAMVTCDVTLDLPPSVHLPLTLASMVLTNGQIEIVPGVKHLAGTVSGSYPPQKLDQPWQASVKLAWERPQQLVAVQSSVASYAVARAERGKAPTLLNLARPGGGIQPYVPALPAKQPVTVPITFDDIQVPTSVSSAKLTYSVAAQDWFGVWSGWANVDVTMPDEESPTPALSDPKWTLLSGSNPFQATLSVQVAWDWTTRSAKQIDLLVSVSRLLDSTTPIAPGTAPAGVQHSVGAMKPELPVSLTFDSAQQPHATDGATVSLVATPSYNASGHDVRVYLVQMPGFTLDFDDKNEIVGQIWATGQANIHPMPLMTPVPVNARVLSPVPPAAPSLEKVTWATLPDAAGTSRVHLKWPPAKITPGGYVVYQASETRLFAVAEAAGWVKPATPLPDLTAPYADRTTMLRSLPWSKVRKAFTRVNSTALPGDATELEVVLPRGSRVLHAFVVTAVSANNIESVFPATSESFTAVATPYVQTSRPPRIFATADAKTGTVTITLEQRGEVTPDHYELMMTRRDDLATDVELMGAPLPLTGVVTKVPGPTPTSPPASVTTVFTHTGVAPSWKRVWYRAVGVTADNLNQPKPTGATPPFGALGARSQPTEAFFVVLPPATAPVAPSVSQMNPKSSGNVLLVLTLDAPAGVTPLGSHVVKAVQRNGTPGTADPQPMYIPLESAPFTTIMPATGMPGQTFRMVLAGGKTVLGIRLMTTAKTTVLVTLTDPLGRMSDPVYTALI